MLPTAVLVGLAATIGIDVGSASAHPLGNLTVNTSTLIVVAPEATTITYVLDLAELPTVQEEPTINEQQASYAANKCASLATGVSLAFGGQPSTLQSTSSTMALLAGQGGLDTLRVECGWTTNGVSNTTAIDWSDTNFVDRVGWREVIAQGDGTRIETDLPTTSASDYLREYPVDSPAPRQLTGHGEVAPGGPRLSLSSAPESATPAAAQDRGADGLTERFNRLVGDRNLTVRLGLFAAVLAFVLGAFHSLAPGHGKTLMAAMVASRRGTPRQVVTVGATVAATHTVGVVILGVIITSSQAIAPDRVLPWLTILSGVLLLATGGWLLARRMLGGDAQIGHHHGVFSIKHDHRHDHATPDRHAHDHHDHNHTGHDHGTHDHDVHEHDHHADDHDHDHEHDVHDHAHHGHGHHDSVAPLRTRSLALIGMAGGLVPTPSALVVLLGATALGRAWFGVALVGVYGIGMASTLVAAGYALVRLEGWVARQYSESRWLVRTMRVLPTLTAAGLVIGGVSLAIRGAVAI